MTKNALHTLFMGLILFATLFSCEKEDNAAQIARGTDFIPADTAQTDTLFQSDSVIYMPNEGEYDYYISMCYSGDQPSVGKNYFYFLFTCTNPELSIESVSVNIQNESISLNKEIYDGEVFYITYFHMDYAEVFHIKITVNGIESECQLKMIDDMITTLPENLTSETDVDLSWQMAIDPQIVYIEGFQYNSSFETLKKSIKNMASADRTFTMPASWLWSENNAEQRAIQIGVINYEIVNRICFTISDNAYKTYN